MIGSLLLLVLFGTITFGLIFNRYQGLQSAAREGARVGALQATSRTDIINRVRESVSVIQASAISSGTCDPTALALDQGCVRIFAKQMPTATCPSTSCIEVLNGNPSQTPCGPTYSGPDKSVLVKVYYRTRIDIPLWASPQMTMAGGAEFKCEN